MAPHSRYWRRNDAVVAELDGCKNENDESAFKPQTERGARDTGDAFLPGGLVELSEKGVLPQDDLSAAFHHAVCWLGDLGWSAERIEARIAGKPIVPECFAKRLGPEIARSLHKRKIEAEAKAKSSPGSNGPNQGPQGARGQGKRQGPPQSGFSGAANNRGSGVAVDDFYAYMYAGPLVYLCANPRDVAFEQRQLTSAYGCRC
jgi:hypothetical protein